jgi:alpha,alpha-trehalase
MKIVALATAIGTVAAAAVDHYYEPPERLLELEKKYMLYRDSKTIVDMQPKIPYEAMAGLLASIQTEDEFKKFVGQHLGGVESDLEIVEIEDFHEAPAYLDGLRDEVKKVGRFINRIWKVLAKRRKEMNEQSTLISTDYPIFVSGGRFREAYYWDSCWIVEGLLASGMHKSAENIVRSFMGLIKKYEFIPNGTRKYYLNRTQPPFYCQMVHSLYRHGKLESPAEFLREALRLAEKEYEFFMRNRRARILDENEDEHILNIYSVETTTPRPESYKEDVELVKDYPSSKRERPSGEPPQAGGAEPAPCKEYVGTVESDTTEKKRTKEDIWSDIKSACESGWDFSTRWLERRNDLTTIQTRKIIPVDLNAIMYRNELILSELYGTLGNEAKAKYYRAQGERRRKSMNKILWNREEGVWNDYNHVKKQHTSAGFYFSNLMPMCYGMEPESHTGITTYHILQKFFRELFEHPGGIPASGEVNEEYKHQWDFPNVWPPHSHMLVVHLLSIGEREMGLHIARRYFRNILRSIEDRSLIFEKYDCRHVGVPGGKGEYEPQEGFGWTNGVAASFIAMYGDLLMGEEPDACSRIHKILEERTSAGSVAGAVPAFEGAIAMGS